MAEMFFLRAKRGPWFHPLTTALHSILSESKLYVGYMADRLMLRRKTTLSVVAFVRKPQLRADTSHSQVETLERHETHSYVSRVDWV